MLFIWATIIKLIHLPNSTHPRNPKQNLVLRAGAPIKFTNQCWSKVLHMEQILLTMEHIARERAQKVSCLRRYLSFLWFITIIIFMHSNLSLLNWGPKNLGFLMFPPIVILKWWVWCPFILNFWVNHSFIIPIDIPTYPEAEGIVATDFLENKFDMERALSLGTSRLDMSPNHNKLI